MNSPVAAFGAANAVVRSVLRSAATCLMAAMLVAGCTEDEVDSRPAAYPVGMSAPPAAPREAPEPYAYPEPPPASPAPAAAEESAPPSAPEDVVIGDETDSPEAPSGQPQDTDPSALTDFRSALDPYGSWVDDPTYGTVWVPSSDAVGPDFTPYVSSGHWAYDDDYTWVSDYEWGWAPFHYGRWVYANGPGWAWIPGRAYAGAWTTWRYGFDDWSYVGWAPLSPTWGWRRGVAVGFGFVPVAPYAFVASGDLFARGLGGRVVGGERVREIAAHTRPWQAPSASVAGRVIAHPQVGGPSPAALRIPESAVVRVGTNASVMQARAFAHPGASSAVYARSAPARSLAPAYGPAAPSHFGGRMGAGFTGGQGYSTTLGGGASLGPRPYFGSSHPYAGRSYHVGGSFVGGGGGPAAGAGRAQSFGASSYGHFSGGGGGMSSASGGGARVGGGYSGGFHGGGGSHVGGGGSRGGGGRGGGHRYRWAIAEAPTTDGR